MFGASYLGRFIPRFTMLWGRNPAGRGGGRASAALPLLDDVTTSPASWRLASARPALAPKCQLIFARTLRSMRHPAHMNRQWDRASVRTLRKRLFAWYRRHRRALPWRADPSPYRVWIAEVMLQQTRVRTMLPYYERFLRRFPSVEALADASEGDVLELWAGLGYYRRARSLRQAARKMMADSGGRFPSTLEQIARLPGVGRYTAGAIHSIAFDQPAPAVDGNVRRVISRVRGIARAPEKFYWSEARAWLARRRPADFNQALMELGALVCAPSRPQCTTCPLRLLCRSASENGKPAPKARAKRVTEFVELAILILQCDGSLVLERQTARSFIPGTWGLPVSLMRKPANPLTTAKRAARSIFDATPEFIPAGTIRHTITHRQILGHLVLAEFPSPRPRIEDKKRYFWKSRPHGVRKLTSSFFLKALGKAGVKGKTAVIKSH
jgi:A/G-specific adenine glycosylase